jgi:hypothetical protein
MPMHRDQIELDERDPFAERPLWTSQLSWPLFGLLGILIFHLTASAPIAATAFCLQFGRRWFLTALWLGRHDPNPGRGATCALFYLSCALSRIVVAALLTTLVLIILFSWADRQADPTPLFVTMGILVAGGFTGAGVLALAGVIRASIQRQPVWVDPMVYWSYRERHWPPLNHVSKNRIENQVSMAQMFVLFGLPTVFILVCRRMPLGNNMPVILGVGPPLLMALCVAIPGLLFYMAKDRVIALSPRQCWGERPPAKPKHDPRDEVLATR